MVNLTDEENRLILEGFDSQGDPTFLLEDAALLPPSGQTAFIVEDLPGLPTTTSTLVARSDERGLVGFFMRGNSPIDRLDGIGRLLPEAKKLYLPLARSGAGGQTSHLDFFNPYPDTNDASFRLFDGNGTQIAEAQHSFPAWGSLKVELQELFDSVGSVDGYIEADAEQILRWLSDLFQQRGAGYSRGCAPPIQSANSGRLTTSLMTVSGAPLNSDSSTWSRGASSCLPSCSTKTGIPWA